MAFLKNIYLFVYLFIFYYSNDYWGFIVMKMVAQCEKLLLFLFSLGKISVFFSSFWFCYEMCRCAPVKHITSPEWTLSTAINYTPFPFPLGGVHWEVLI